MCVCVDEIIYESVFILFLQKLSKIINQTCSVFYPFLLCFYERSLLALL